MNWYNFLMVFFVGIILLLCIIFLLSYLFSKETTEYIPNIDDSKSNMKLLLKKDSVERINNILDTHIRNASNNYMSLTVSYTNEIYITDAMQKEMSEYIFQTVKKNMTQTMIDALSLIYVINTEEDLNEILIFRIKLFMITEIVKTNQEIE